MKSIRIYLNHSTFSEDFYSWSYQDNACKGGDGCGDECSFTSTCDTKGFTLFKRDILRYLPANSDKEYILLTPETYPEVFI